MSNIADCLTPRRECEQPFDIIASLRRGEAAIAFIASVMSTTVMLMATVARNIFTWRIGVFIVMMMTVRAVIDSSDRL